MATKEITTSTEESRSPRELLIDVDKIGITALQSFGMEWPGNRDSENFEYKYADLGLWSREITDALVTTGVIEINKIAEGLKSVHGGAVIFDHSSVGLEMRTYEGIGDPWGQCEDKDLQGPKVAEEDQARIIEAELTFVLKSPTRNEHHITDQGYEYYPTAGVAQVSLTIPTQLPEGTDPFYLTNVVVEDTENHAFYTNRRDRDEFAKTEKLTSSQLTKLLGILTPAIEDLSEIHAKAEEAVSQDPYWNQYLESIPSRNS
jgi:hypothetical protein